MGFGRKLDFVIESTSTLLYLYYYYNLLLLFLSYISVKGLALTYSLITYWIYLIEIQSNSIFRIVDVKHKFTHFNY